MKKPFSCTQCASKFADLANLRIHSHWSLCTSKASPSIQANILVGSQIHWSIARSRPSASIRCCQGIQGCLTRRGRSSRRGNRTQCLTDRHTTGSCTAHRRYSCTLRLRCSRKPRIQSCVESCPPSRRFLLCTLYPSTTGSCHRSRVTLPDVHRSMRGHSVVGQLLCYHPTAS